ncbi:MAG: 4-hydroxy-3-methylbut-2-enyl diphosphate reductase [Candidatus Poribacteria bacterium]|nr:4-hydroxy-3-methylbut-2-enyl diphosphate reductase [Candidatus Poribacteria bacterium]
MPREFDVPLFYRSPVISVVKKARRLTDPRKRDLSPAVLDFGPVRFKIARHFGFCYGVENAIEIAYRALSENPGVRIFLLSEMIHNPHVNADLQQRGVQFLCETSGKQLIPFDELTPADIVIVPAFGTTLEVEAELSRRGIEPYAYNTTCPFVEKVWKKSQEIGRADYTVVVHGKRYHEETRATFSHSKAEAPVVVVLNLEEAKKLAKVIRGESSREFFFDYFADRYSPGFEPDRDLKRIGVVNQTTMLATETQAIADLLRSAMIDRYGEEHIDAHFADTKDTLCYATKENQDATLALIDDGGDLALVVGGYNSSNTSHLVELCERKLPTYFVCDADEMRSPTSIRHLDIHTKTVRETVDWLPINPPRSRLVDIVLTAGASCPDALLDEVMRKVLSWFSETRSMDAVLAPYRQSTN